MNKGRPAPVAAAADERRKALSMLLIANFYWGLSFPVIKALVFLQARLQPDASGALIVGLVVAPRFLLGFAVLALWPRRGPRIDRSGESPFPTRNEWKQGLIIGGFAAAGMLLQNDGLRFTAASTSAFLTQFYAILIPVWLALRTRRPPTLVTGISCVLVLVGVAVLGRFSWRELRLGRGEWETLLSSVFFMGQILCLENKAYAGNRPRSITLVLFGTVGAVCCAWALMAAPRIAALTLPWTSSAWIGLTLILAVFCTVGSYSIMNAWQTKISATEAGLIYCIEPIFSSLLALFLPAFFSRWAGIAYANERATANLLVGGGLITAANLLIQRQRA